MSWHQETLFINNLTGHNDCILKKFVCVCVGFWKGRGGGGGGRVGNAALFIIQNAYIEFQNYF